MRHSVQTLIVGAPVLLLLVGMTGCATPRAELSPEIRQLADAKIPLTVAVILPMDRRERVWQPDIAWQGFVPRPVYPGRVLAETLLESLNLIFERALIVEDEEEAITKGVSAFIAVECYISAVGTADLQGESLLTHIRMRFKDLNSRTILSVHESGGYLHIWTAVDDGAVQRTVIEAVSKALPKIVKSRELKEYVEHVKAGDRSTAAATRRERRLFRQKISYEVNAPQNYIDAPFYGLKQRIAVADFDTRLSEIPGGLYIGQGLSEMLITELVKTGRFIVVEREALAAIIAEQQLGQTGLITKETAVKVGNLLGAQLIAKGVVSEADEKQYGGQGGVTYKGGSLDVKSSTRHAAVEIRLIDTATGEVLYSHTAHGRVSDLGVSVGVQQKDMAIDMASFQKTPFAQAVRRAIFDAIRFIISKIDDVPVETQVIMIKGENIYINAGSLMNVQIGDRLVVYSRSQEFTDPKTGKVLGSEAVRAGIVEVTEVENKFSIGRLVSGKGKLKRGDMLRFDLGQGERN